MRKFVINWVLGAVAIYVIALILPGMTISGFGAALMACLVLGIVNAVIKPIMLLLTLPLNILTLGVFSLVINALMLMLTSGFVSGFNIKGFLTAFIASIVLSFINVSILDKKK